MGFLDNYEDRTSGLKRFNNPNELLPFIYPPTPATQSVPAQPAKQAFETKSPTEKALDIANEAYNPGHIDQQSQPQAAPFRDSFMGRLAETFIPGVRGGFEQDRGNDIQKYVTAHADDPVAQITGIMKLDPRNAEKYLPALLTASQDQHALTVKTGKNKQITDYLASIDGSQPAAAPTITGSSPIGARNNNFLNIKTSPANAWQGQVGQDGGFATFDSAPAGFRAGAKILQKYAEQGINDIDGLINKWAPASDHNDVVAYANFVAKESGIPRNANFSLSDPKTQAALLDAMQKFEVGPENALPSSAVVEGVQLASGGAGQAQAPQKKALTEYQRTALDLAKIDPEHFTDNALAAMKPDASDKATPYTAEGKAMSDFKNGLITKEQMNAGGGENSVITPENASLTGDAFIDTIPSQDVRNKARGLLKGKIPYPVVNSRTPAVMKQALEAAQQADSSYSASSYPARVQNDKYFQPSGEGGKLLSSVKAIAQHINTMSKSYKSIDNSGFTPWNYITDNLAKVSDNQTHSGLNAFKTAVNNVAPEMAKVIAGKTNVPESEVKDQRDTFSQYDGPEAFNASTTTAAEMVAARAQIMLDNYRQVMNSDGKPPAPNLDKGTIETFKKLGVDLNEYFDTSAKEDAPAPDGIDADTWAHMTPAEQKAFKQ